MTQSQKDRLLKEIKRTPGMTTGELAALISAPYQAVYDLLHQVGMQDRVYSIKFWAGAGVGKPKVRWYAIGAQATREEPPAGLTADTGITADDLAWMAHYRQKFNRRQESRRV